jgi:AAA domain
MTVTFTPPLEPTGPTISHARAAARNAAVAEEAIGQLRDRLSGANEIERILLKAAAGAGKSYVLKMLVADAIEHPRCLRVAVIAFQNRQLWPIAASLGKTIVKERVCLFASKAAYDDVPRDVFECAVVSTTTSAIPDDCAVIVATSHRLGAMGERQRLLDKFGPAANGDAPFDVLFVDEAWQLPHHLFDKVSSLAPIVVGVGDVGQLPPIEIGTNPWRGDPGYNPYRAWPTGYDNDPRTWTAELPAVWRPAAAHLPLWRAFYPEWKKLNCVAAPGDRVIALEGLNGLAAQVWQQVATGAPVLLEVDGLGEAEAPDVDLPLTQFVEHLLDELFAGGFALEKAQYDDAGSPTGEVTVVKPGDEPGDPLVAILATRNQAVDDATAAAERLKDKHGLAGYDLIASTVDSWQGQTNGLTVAIHPLTGASQLDEFNSAFGRLAVACTRATHGLLLVSRPGLDQLLAETPARPGTPFGEPGNRHLPRQTHQRILATFTRGIVSLTPTGV